MPDDFDYSAFTGQFVAECGEHLEALNRDLLKLEEDPGDEEAMAEIVRAAHTIKGAAKMMGAEDVAVLSHKLEDLLGEVKEGRVKLETGLFDDLFKSFDGLDNLLKACAGEEAKPVDTAGLTDKLNSYTGAAEAGTDNPSAEQPPAAEKTTEETKSAPAKSAAAVKPATAGKLTTAGKPEETIRVAAGKLDDLANLTGELVISQIRQKEREQGIRSLIDTHREQELAISNLIETMNRLKLADEYFSEIERLEASRGLMDAGLQALRRGWREDTAQLEMLVNQLKQEVLGARMVPVSTLFDSFSRPVRDLARQFKKDVELSITGGETELDRRMIEVMHDPMIHMIRNAVDHGIEDPEARKKAGKPARGRLHLDARQEGEYVVIEMSDDGAGIDLAKVRTKAVKRKLIDKAEAAGLSEAELVQLLFKPGFSTSDIITDISGRGVGMDVIKQSIERLKGMVYLQTERGRGTTVTLKVPLTLAMARVMFVKASGHVYAIPTTSIEETLRLKLEDIKTVENREAMLLRGHAVPLTKLASILGANGGGQILDKRPVVIINLGGVRVGLIVDELVEEHEVVIKTLGRRLSSIRNIAGATVLGNGDVVLILNPPDLVAAAKGLPVELAPAAEESKETVVKQILIVDDSATTRGLEKSILESAGYQVDEAIDGIDALAKVSKKAYDLLVVDVQMPKMDGLTLTKKIKGNQRYEDIPVVMVTTLEKEEDKKRGIEAGADAYIIKRAFDQANLLSVIEQLTAAG
ncbi:MAG: hybrid sensor histidine kinase/response regulator [Actinomycetota bacterium]